MFCSHKRTIVLTEYVELDVQCKLEEGHAGDHCSLKKIGDPVDYAVIWANYKRTSIVLDVCSKKESLDETI